MKDIKKLINYINEKVYREEPILITASQMINFTPPKYRQMRQIAKNDKTYYGTDAKIFYEQGKFMEDFEDEFEYNGEFMRYYPTYQSMSDQQLRGYFSWRTKVRKGIIEKTSLSFVFVYIYELLNGIGVKTPLDGYNSLKELWVSYKDLDPKIDFYIKLWMKDYIVYYGLDKSLLEEFMENSFYTTVVILRNYLSYTPDEVFYALNSLSSYNIEKSGLFKLYPDEVKYVAYNVFCYLSEYYSKNCKNDICDKFFGKIFVSTHTMFNSAIFYDRLKYKKYLYEINDLYKYKCENGIWKIERFFYYKGKNKKIGELLKTIDYILRQHYQYKTPLKMEKIIKLYSKAVIAALNSHQAEKEKIAKEEIVIDTSKLSEIRAAAKITQNKLITEEEQEEIELIESQTTSEEPHNLTDLESEFLKCLLYGKPYKELLKANGIMESVIIDSVNVKLYEIFNDTIISFDGMEYEIISDYTDELKGLFK